VTVVPWAERLAEAGLVAVVAPLPAARETSRPLAVLTAARDPVEVVPMDDVPWPERVLAARVGALEIVNVHSPISPKPGLAKVLTHEAVFRHLAAGAGPRVVLGDLNTPRKELPDGTVWTFARDRYGRLREDRGERWDVAESALVRGLEEHGFRDAFRELNGFDSKEPSWEWPRWGGGYRLDHLIASTEVTVSACSYRHDWRRDDRLSDHSALVAELSVAGTGRR
jgi:endonuclease/exonuclease/phosphatase family metal-dependent hydrolase